MTRKIGIISDTHGLLRKEVKDILKTCDCILHAGDVDRPEILDQLRVLGNIYVVRGNNDGSWAEKISRTLRFEIAGVKFFMVHNKKELPSDLEDTDVVIFGHSHKYVQEHKNGRLWLNPGSCGKRRFDQEITFAVMTVRDGQYQVKKYVVPQDIKAEKGKKKGRKRIC